MERKILEGINFKIPKTTILDEVVIKLLHIKQILSSNIFPEDKCTCLYGRIKYICMLLMHSLEFATRGYDNLSYAILVFILKEKVQDHED